MPLFLSFHLFKLHSTHNIFCFVYNNTGLPWAIYHKKKAFLIFVAKTRWNQLYSIKNNILVCLPYNCVVASVIAPEKVFLPVCSDLPWLFTSFYWKQRFYLCLARWRCFGILFLRTTFTSVFVTKLHFWCSILLEKCFGLLVTKLDYLWAVYHKNHCFCLSVFRKRKNARFCDTKLKPAQICCKETKRCFW